VKPTEKHIMAVPRPGSAAFDVPPDRVRLNAFDKKVYLARTVEAAASAARSLERDILIGVLKPVGQPALERRGADAIYMGTIEVLVANSAPSED
jgi:hypothetical protein